MDDFTIKTEDEFYQVTVCKLNEYLIFSVESTDLLPLPVSVETAELYDEEGLREIVGSILADHLAK
jgi:hypothetical protein